MFVGVQNNIPIFCQTTTYCNCSNQQQKSRHIHQTIKWSITIYLIPARCFKGIPASTRAAQAAFIAHTRS